MYGSIPGNPTNSPSVCAVIQFLDAAEDDLSSHVDSQDMVDARKAVLVAQHLNAPSDWDSHDDSKMDDHGMESQSHERVKQYKRDIKDDSMEQHSYSIDSRESSKVSQESHSREDMLAIEPKSTEEDKPGKSSMSHELDSASSEIN